MVIDGKIWEELAVARVLRRGVGYQYLKIGPLKRVKGEFKGIPRCEGPL